MPRSQDEVQSRAAGMSQSVMVLWALLFVVWLVVNASLELPIVVVGAALSFVLAWIFVRRSEIWRIECTPRTAFHFLAYTGVFIVELVKANLNMLRYVYAPRIDIHPGIVKVNMRLKSPLGRLALANSIALTPGSLVHGHRGRRPVHPLARRPDHGSGGGDRDDRRPVRTAPGGGIWLIRSSQIAVVLIFLSIVFGVVRLIVGRTVVDRVVAIDMLTVVTIALIALYAHLSGRFVYLDVALVYGLLSFLAVLAIARFLERGP